MSLFVTNMQISTKAINKRNKQVNKLTFTNVYYKYSKSEIFYIFLIIFIHSRL